MAGLADDPTDDDVQDLTLELAEDPEVAAYRALVHQDDGKPTVHALRAQALATLALVRELKTLRRQMKGRRRTL